ncbi:alpha-amylase family glycosyl hydrolase [Limnoraphis robusta Tam1]|uniref:alpha-amylase family glycosyl hydrolase n=1 Tax=Limnoraphis robusta TaxID=1118279 RepID=UPI002B2122D4|nr:alpha-amylase family glycosyl hydrolase [Limnoraphis robusta]MEA5542587.1 alpha-amylase family glycosyl hydrolase [Limnoraphis robusta Tam1]
MIVTQSLEKYESFQMRVQPLLEIIYDEPTVKTLLKQIFALLQDYSSDFHEENLNKWSQDNILLITYGNSLQKRGETPLVTLKNFLEKYLKDTITGVHILPFFPYSSDDGFSVIDYLRVNPQLGDWEDIKNIANQFDLMSDLVINHISSQSDWFQQFQRGEKPGCDYFITVDPKTDLSAVVRPRSTPVLTPVDTPSGEKHVWATFSADQIDLNFANPNVLLEFIKIILIYIEEGAKYIRLDAVGFLWKEIGTSCIHLPQTHAVVKLLRELVQLVNPHVVLITETNVPNRENLSYFGNRNEAHMIYNFSLPPLLLHALLQGKSDYLKTWMMSMPPAPLGCAYFNFTASHDGIGLRPTEGLLSEQEYYTMLETMQQFGGKVSMRKKPDGSESPYELNISLFDAMKGTVKGEDKWQVKRFLCSQTVMMSLEGIPAFYIHSLLATPNDYYKLKLTGRNRSINRSELDLIELEDKLSHPHSPQSIVFRELCRRIQIRRRQTAFHPNATQYTLQLKPSLFGFWRQSIIRDQSIFCIFNLTDQPQLLQLSELNLVCTDPWCDLISGEKVDDIYSCLTLHPYQAIWLTNKF